MRIHQHSRWLARSLCAGLVVIAAGAMLSACGGSGEKASSHYSEAASRPARVETVGGTDVKRVMFSAEGAKKTGLRTAAIRKNGESRVMPYSALLYDSRGNTFTYTSPEPLTFVREEVRVERVEGDHVVLSEGPPAGTRVVTVGAQEVYGAEFEVEGE